MMFLPTPALATDWAFGRKDTRPIKIFASINTRSFGEVLTRLLYVNTVAGQFDNARVTLLYRNDAHFKRDLMRLLPTAYQIEVDSDAQLPSLDIVSPRTLCVAHDFRQWHDLGLHEQDLVITEGMATEIGLLGFDRLEYLRIPVDMVSSCMGQLLDRGLNPKRWFATMHARESGYYTAARNNYRNADLATYRAAAEHIIARGGQVVRLGHPEMTSWGPIAGLVELGLEPDNSLLQAFAVSRSRFLVAGPTGPMALAEAFHVPAAYANGWSLYYNNDRAIVRTVDLVAPDGTVTNQAAIVAMIPYGLKPLLQQGYQARQIDTAEMLRLVDAVYDATGDVQGWRRPDAPYDGVRPNRLVWPGELVPKGQWL